MMELLHGDTLHSVTNFLDLSSLGKLESADKSMIEKLDFTRAKADALVRDFNVDRLKCNTYKEQRLAYEEIPSFKKLFYPKDETNDHRIKVSSDAVKRLLLMGKQQNWDDLDAFVGVTAMEAANKGNVENLRSMLTARQPRKIRVDKKSGERIDDDDDSGSSSDEDDDKDYTYIYEEEGGETGPLLVNAKQLGFMFEFVVASQDTQIIKMILNEASNVEYPDDIRLTDKQLNQAFDVCTLKNNMTGCALLMANLTKRFPDQTEPAIRRGIKLSAESGILSMCTNFTNMLLFRVNSGFDKDNEQSLIRMKQAKDTLYHALSFASQKGYLEIFKFLILKYELPKVVINIPESNDDEYAQSIHLLKTAASNGHKEICHFMFNENFVNDTMVRDLFIDAIRRNFTASIESIIDLDIYNPDFLKHQKEQAFLREADDIAKILETKLKI